MKCPVVSAIEEIRGGGWEDDCMGDTNVVKIGGIEGSIYVSDDVQYYMMTKKMEIARFELSQPGLVECRIKYHVILNRSRTVSGVINRTLPSHLYRQFVELVDIIGSMEDVILLRIKTLNRTGRYCNLSIPDIILLPNIDQIIIYRPDILCQTMNKIIDYVNKINVSALLKTPIVAQISKVSALEIEPPIIANFTETIFSTADEYIAEIKKINTEEMKVCEYVKNIEKYHVEVINHMNQVYDYCQKIIDNMI